MTSFSISLLLVAAVCHSLRAFMIKRSEEKLLFVWWMTLFSLLLISPFCIYFIIQTQPGFEAIRFALGMGLIHASYWTLYTKAFEKGDISHVYPIIHSSPAFVLVFGILFLKEYPSLMGILGILTINVGLYLINMKNFHWKSLFDPLLSIANERHTQLAFLSLIFVITYSLCDKVAVSKLHPLAYMFIMTISAFSIFSFFIRKQLKDGLKNSLNGKFKNAWLAAIFTSVNYAFTLIALRLTSASYTTGFRQISVVFAVLIGTFFLNEQSSKLRLFSSALIFTGAVLVAI